jgi:hypothetical protein
MEYQALQQGVEYKCMLGQGGPQHGIPQLPRDTVVHTRHLGSSEQVVLTHV